MCIRDRRVGLTEEEAKKRGHRVKIGVFPMIGNARSLISGETRGMVKIVADDKYGEVLGVHIMGARATDLVSEASLAIRLEATLELSLIHISPREELAPEKERVRPSGDLEVIRCV